MIVCIYNYS